MDKTTGIFKALSDRNRLRVICALLETGELCACQITGFLEVTGATASRHMGILISSGLVTSRKCGRWVYYSIIRGDSDLDVLYAWITDQIKDCSDMKADCKRLEDIISCDPGELCRLQRGAV